LEYDKRVFACVVVVDRYDNVCAFVATGIACDFDFVFVAKDSCVASAIDFSVEAFHVGTGGVHHEHVVDVDVQVEVDVFEIVVFDFAFDVSGVAFGIVKVDVTEVDRIFVDKDRVGEVESSF
jgi:hypothetical protein